MEVARPFLLRPGNEARLALAKINKINVIKLVHTLWSTRYVPLDAMEISYTNTRVHTLHVDIVQWL